MRIKVAAVILCVAAFVSGCKKMNSDGVTDVPMELEAVDLGLPSGTLWASQNLLADRPWALGGEFAWGETNVSDNKTQYQDNNKYGSPGGPYILEPEDDAASVILGEEWRMPTEWDFEELKEYCNWESTIIKNIEGYKITSRVSSNSIFLPVRKVKGLFSIIEEEDFYYYWTSCSYGSNAVLFSRDATTTFKSNRMRIRPVLAGRAPLESISLEQSSFEVAPGREFRLKVLFSPVNAWDRRIKWTSSSGESAYVDGHGYVTALYPGTAQISATSTALGYSRDASVKVTDFTLPEKVDMGLPSGLLWADCNMGANEENNLGLRFAIGETRPKMSFTEMNYNGAVYWSEEGLLALGFDVASDILGDGWRIPTLEDYRELVENSTINVNWESSVVDIISNVNGNILHMPYDVTCWTSTPLEEYCSTSFIAIYGGTLYKGEKHYCSRLNYWNGGFLRPVFNDKVQAKSGDF